VTNYQSTVPFGELVEGAISTNPNEIAELDMIGFDETIPVEEFDDT
jgi:hypothetical protein